MMEKPKDLLCLEGISCLSFNKDQSFCVLSKKDANLYIYETKDKLDISTWQQVNKLSGHLQYICAVDWHPETNKIISASHDRNMLVWSYNLEKISWTQEIVNLKLKVSVLDVKWNSRGDKFVGSTGSKLVATGYYSEETKMWTCNSMKEHKSSVTCARFDNSGLFILSGSTDLKAIISSAFIEHVDNAASLENLSLPYTKAEFGEELSRFSLGGWVNSVAWSPNSLFAFIATHDAILMIVNTADKSSSNICVTHAPISLIVPVTDYLICAVAYDRNIYEYGYDADAQKWSLKKCITKDESSASNTESISTPTSTATTSSGGFQDKLKAFKGGFLKKQSLIVTSVVQKDTHFAHINSAHLVNERFLVTSDFAGFVKVWNI